MGQLIGKNSERIRNELSSGTLRKGFRKLRNELLGRSEMNRKSSERFRKQSSHRIRKASESVLFPKPFLSFRQGSKSAFGAGPAVYCRLLSSDLLLGNVFGAGPAVYCGL